MTKKAKTTAVQSAALTFAAVTVQNLDALAQRRVAWEGNEFKKANEMLYALLADCYVQYEQRVSIASDTDKKAVRAELKARLVSMGVRVQVNSTTLAMMVRFVFGSDRKRAHGYAYVIKAAITHEVAAADMAAWIVAQGGIEEIKRKNVISDNALAAREQREAALGQVREGVELALINPVGLVEFGQPMELGEHAVLVVRAGSAGQAEVLAVLKRADTAVVEALYKRIAKECLVEKAEEQTMQAEAGTTAAVKAKPTVAAEAAEAVKPLVAKAPRVAGARMAKRVAHKELLAA